MKIAEPQNIMHSISFKIAALASIMFVSGVTGIMLFQFTSTHNSGYIHEESLDLNNQHVWANQSGWSESAIVVVNTGVEDVMLERIVIRSIECHWNDVYYWKTTTGPISSELEQTSTELSGTSFGITIDGTERTFQQATNMLVLESKYTIILYVKNPGNITSDDDNLKVTITIFTEKKLYYQEAYVEATFTFMATEEIKITNMQFGGTGADKWVAVTANNTGTTAVTINEAWINNVKQTITVTTLDANQRTVLNMTYTWSAGNNYQVKLMSSKGNNFVYSAVAPTS